MQTRSFFIFNKKYIFSVPNHKTKSAILPSKRIVEANLVWVRSLGLRQGLQRQFFAVQKAIAESPVPARRAGAQKGMRKTGGKAVEIV